MHLGKINSEVASTMWSQVVWLCCSVLLQEVVLESKRRDMDALHDPSGNTHVPP